MKKYMLCFCLFLLGIAPSSIEARWGTGAFFGGALLGGLTGAAIAKSSSKEPQVVYVQQPAPVYADSYADEPDDDYEYIVESQESSDNDLITYYENIQDGDEPDNNDYIQSNEDVVDTLGANNNDDYEYVYVDDEN